jgi:N-acetylglucosamine-6-phosphate deacetylase
MPPGKYQMGDFEFEVRDGRCLANGVIAGSLLTLDQAVRNVMKFAGWDLQSALGAATVNPASAAKVDAGRLKAGAPADLVAFDAEGQVRATVIRGRVMESEMTLKEAHG